VTSRDPFGPDDPTPATAPGDASTPPQGMPILPDWEDGFVHGRQRGIADTADALRRALLLVGVPFSDVELIVLRVRGLIR
jgi:hypothetical protein